MRTSRTGRWGAAAVAVSAALALAAPATAAIDSGRADFEPGAPGVGDPYYPNYGNGGYDVRHYDLSVRYDKLDDSAGTGFLDGTALITARATQDLSRFNLDFVGMTVRSVHVNGRKATWSRTRHELRVTPPTGLDRGDQFTVEVSYDGEPVTFAIAGTTLEAGFIHTEDGATVAGQPEVATAWFPVNDHPQDRARYTYRVTVPDEDEVVANGLPRGTKSRNGWTTHVWKVDDPQISYLATIDIGQWDVERYRLDDGLPVIDAIDPAIDPTRRANAEASLARQPEIHDALEGWFGKYPFKTSGGIVDNYDNLRFALETQGRPVYSKFFFSNGPNPGVVVHEIAHQWFGDSVAVHHWADIWLNEGFASYAEWLWSEHDGGPTAQEIFDAMYAGIPADDPFWDVTIGDPGADDLFHGAVYDRGAMTAHALRKEVGDAAYWDTLRTWVRRNANGNGSTAEFMRLAERRSGQQLDSFFDTWLFTGEKPPASAVSTRSSGADSAANAEARAWVRDWRASAKHRLDAAGRH